MHVDHDDAAAITARVRAQSMDIGFFSRWRVHASPFFNISAISASFFGTMWILFSFLQDHYSESGHTQANAELNFAGSWPGDISGFVNRVASDLLIFASVVALLFVIMYGAFLWHVLVRRPNYIASHAIEGSARGRILNLVGKLPRRAVRKLVELDQNDRDPFIVCRSGCHAFSAYMTLLFDGSHLLSRLQTERRISSTWGKFNQLNYLVTLAYADALRLDWKQMRGEGYLYSDQITNRDEQKSIVREFNECDLPLRFIQAEPQRRFVRMGGAQLPKPKYVMFHCLFNTNSDPIWVLPLTDVLSKLKELCEAPNSGTDYDSVIRFLSNAAFSVFARIRDEPGPEVLKLQFGESRQVAILHKSPDGTFLSGYDENCILYEQLPPPACAALHLFQRAIDEASKKAVRIQLKSGDVLLIKNQEAFFARREVHDHFISWPPLIAPRCRWLRTYYLYSKLPSEDLPSDGGGTQHALAAGGQLFVQGIQLFKHMRRES